jgi:hypothetical protein
MSKSFRVEPFDSIDKSITIVGPEITIAVDYDDVNHPQVRKDIKKLVKILNENWEKE